MNVTDTEFVVVEDTTAWDTNAVILKVGLCANVCQSELHIYSVHSL